MNMQRFIYLFVLGAASLNLFAGPDNIAPFAKVTVSSEHSPASGGDYAIDGRIGVENCFEWVSRSRMTYWGEIDYPWIQLTWDKPRVINRVILYDRATTDSHTGGGLL
ncbi:MAG: glycoside hydrolase family 92 protein, partial [Tannerella sp.]|nr:glycoside hydrolase family 92 protein [Tannerella sp.]